MNTKLTALLLVICLIVFCFPKLCESQEKSYNTADSLKLILTALNKAEHYQTEIELLKTQLKMCESAIDTIQVIKTVQNVEFKTDWLMTTVISTIALLLNWSIYLIITQSK
jgi:hypothetical protein